MSLEELRGKVDELDACIVEMVARRIKISEEIGARKRKLGKPVTDAEREKAVLERIRRAAREAGVSEEDMAAVYRQVFTASKRLQGVVVAFQGEAGAYSEGAAYQFFGDSIRTLPSEDIDGVFRAVEQGQANFGVIPVENSLEGSISRSYDLLLDSDLKVCGEIHHRVVHCLIGLPGATLDTIKKVYSHPQALGQCSAFLKHMGWELIPTYDTAGSVKMIKEAGEPERAAVASERAAGIYGMKILAREIEDNPQNYTRFFILSRQDAPPTGQDKTSIVFSVKHRPGALYQALQMLAERKINLTKIESRPTRKKAWEYNFYLDFEGHREDKLAKEALDRLEEQSLFVKVLGSYPKATQ